jgi:CheY-like chemotaxis protein
MLAANSIMIIDDDADDRMIFSESVNRVNSNLICHEASNAMEGFNKLLGLDKLPDYVFVDVNMPNMSGFELLAKIRKTTVLDKLKVIIYTTSNQKSAIETARDLGANGFLTKPDEMELLLNYLQKLLNSPQTAAFIEFGLLCIVTSLANSLFPLISL